MNAAELDQNRMLDELGALDSGGEGDAASVNSQEPPETLRTKQEIETMHAAAAELKSLGAEAVQATAAEVADKLVRMTRAGETDEQMLFNRQRDASTSAKAEVVLGLTRRSRWTASPFTLQTLLLFWRLQGLQDLWNQTRSRRGPTMDLVLMGSAISEHPPKPAMRQLSARHWGRPLPLNPDGRLCSAHR